MKINNSPIFKNRGVKYIELKECWLPFNPTITFYADPKIYLIVGVFGYDTLNIINEKLIRGRDNAYGYAQKYSEVMTRISKSVNKIEQEMYIEPTRHNMYMYNKYYRFAEFIEVRVLPMEIE
jgi:hypothetical protein